MNEPTMYQTKASGDEVDEVVQRVLSVIDPGENRFIVIMGLISIIMWLYNAGLTDDQVIDGVRDISQYISLYVHQPPMVSGIDGKLIPLAN